MVTERGGITHDNLERKKKLVFLLFVTQLHYRIQVYCWSEFPTNFLHLFSESSGTAVGKQTIREKAGEQSSWAWSDDHWFTNRKCLWKGRNVLGQLLKLTALSSHLQLLLKCGWINSNSLLYYAEKNVCKVSSYTRTDTISSDQVFKILFKVCILVRSSNWSENRYSWAQAWAVLLFSTF